MRYFTLAEAEALLPELEKIYAAVAELAARAEAKAERIRALEGPRGDATQLAIERSQFQFLANSVHERLQEVVDLGAVPKGLAPALVDFPSRLGGREVYLCWKLGEERIGFYHGIEEGFAGRKPLPKK